MEVRKGKILGEEGRERKESKFYMKKRKQAGDTFWPRYDTFP